MFANVARQLAMLAATLAQVSGRRPDIDVISMAWPAYLHSGGQFGTACDSTVFSVVSSGTAADSANMLFEEYTALPAA